MAKYEARVKTTTGEIAVNFDSTDELKRHLESLDAEAVSNIISEKFGSIVAKEPRLPKPGLESLYRFTPDGKVELLKTPSSAPMTIGVLLYASDPESMSFEEFLFRGITAGNYAWQTNYKKYFFKTPDSKLVLTQQGRQWVETDIIPQLVPKPSS
jgi:hypothetical protein